MTYSYDRRAGYSGPVTTIEVDLPSDCDGVDAIIAYLKFLQYLGGVGASRGLEVQDHGTITGWDGDGADQIIAIRRDGQEVEKPGEHERELLRRGG